jgi:hypothetical protein
VDDKSDEIRGSYYKPQESGSLTPRVGRNASNLAHHPHTPKDESDHCHEYEIKNERH